MSARAALKVGAGLVTLLLPERAAEETSASITEIMCASLPEENGNFSTSVQALPSLMTDKSALVLGPGDGTTEGAKAVVSLLLVQAKSKNFPLVIDADALNLIAQEESLKKLLGKHAVLTPHPGEMGRLIGASPSEVQQSRIEVAREFSSTYNCWLVLKGARTLVASPEGKIFVNPAANSVLATAGSGDVLAGIIGGILARGATAGEAAISGVLFMAVLVKC